MRRRLPTPAWILALALVLSSQIKSAYTYCEGNGFFSKAFLGSESCL